MVPTGTSEHLAETWPTLQGMGKHALVSEIQEALKSFTGRAGEG